MTSTRSSWRHSQSYAERRQAYANHISRVSTLKGSNELSTAIRVTKVPSKHTRHPRRGERAHTSEGVILCQVGTTIASSVVPRYPIDIPYDKIQLEIITRAVSECPKPPPNSPPTTSPRTVSFRCGDFTYNIPIDDTFTMRLFAQGDDLHHHPNEPEEKEVKSYSPSAGLGLRLSVSAGKLQEVKSKSNDNIIHAVIGAPGTIPKRVVGTQSERCLNRKQHDATFQNWTGRRLVGTTKSHSSLPFVHNPRIAKFLEEIKAAKEKKLDNC